MKKLNFTLIIGLSILFFASCSTTLERKIQPSKGNWNPIASSSKSGNSKIGFSEKIDNEYVKNGASIDVDDSNLTMPSEIVEFKESKSSENVGQKS